MYLKCRWRGFTAEMDTWQTLSVLCNDCPACVADYQKAIGAGTDPVLDAAIARELPALAEQQRIQAQRGIAGTVSSGRRRRRNNTGASRTRPQVHSDSASE